MAEENDNVVGFDISAVEAGVEKFARIMEDKYNKTLTLGTTIGARFNQEGKVIGYTMNSMTAAGAELSQSFRVVGDTLERISVKIKDNNKNLDSEITRLRALAQASDLAYSKNAKGQYRSTETGRMAGKTPESTWKNASDAEKDALTRMIALDKQMVAQKKAAEAEVSSIVDQGYRERLRIQDQEFQGFLEEERIIKAHQEKIERFYRETTATIVAERNKIAQLNAQDAQRASAGSAFSKGAISSQSSSFRRATPQAVSAYTASVGSLGNMIAEGKTNASEINKIYSDITNKVGKAYEGMQAEVAKNVNKMIVAEERLTGATAKHKNNQSKAYKDHLNQSKQTAKELLITWDTVFRFLQFRLLYAGIFETVQQMKIAAQTAIELKIRIAEIQTISQDASLSTNDWANQIQRLSNEFGSPVMDVAGGIYETVSNQIAKGADAARFMGTALKFAATTASTATDSVNLLSSTLNSFEIDTSRAEAVAAILFRTIDLGRVTATEMANTFGRVGVSSHAVGVTLEETAAAIATLTINGTKFSEAQTQITSITSALLKPSEEMKKVLKGWGVESGEAAISTFGFVGVLRKLEEAAQGSSTEMAALFPNVRGLRGVVGLTRSSLQDYEATLAKVNDTTALYQKATEIAFNNSGRVINIELNKIKNYFINDFGIPITDALAGVKTDFSSVTGIIGNTVHSLGGLNNTVATTVKWATVLVQTWVTWRAVQLVTNKQGSIAISLLEGWSNSIDPVNNKTVKLTATAQRLRGVTAGLGNAAATVFTKANIAIAAMAAGFYLYNQYQDDQAKLMTVQQDAIDSLTEKYEKANVKRQAILDIETKAVTDAVSDQYKVQLQGVADQRILIDQAMTLQQAKTKDFAANIKDIFELQAKAGQEAINKLESRISSAQSNIKKAAEAIRSLTDDTDKRRFDVKFNAANDLGKVAIAKQQIKDLAAQIPKLLDPTQGDPIQVQQNMTTAMEKQRQISEGIAKLADQRTDAEAKRKELIENIAELELQATDKGAIKAARANLDAIAKLEDEYRKEGSNKTQIAKDIATRKANAKKAVSETTDAAGSRRAAQQMAAAQLELENLNKIIAQLPTQQNYLKAEDAYRKTTADAMERLVAAQKESLTIDEKSAEAAKSKLKAIQTAFENINKFKLGKDQGIPQFDTLVGKAIDSGLTDQSTLFALSKLRVQLEVQANEQIKLDKLKSNADTLEAQKQQVIKQQSDLVDLQKKFDAQVSGNVIKLQSDFELGKQASKFFGVQQGDFENLTKSFYEKSYNFQNSKSGTDLIELQAQAKALVTELAKTTSPGNVANYKISKFKSSVAQDPFKTLAEGNYVIKKGDPSKNEKDLTFSDFQLGIKVTLDNLTKSIQQGTELKNSQAGVQSVQASLGVNSDAIKKQIELKMQELGSTTDVYNKALEASTKAVENMDIAIKNFNATLGGKALPPTTKPISFNRPASTGGNTSNSYEVNVYPQAGPSGQIDTVALVRDINRKIRSGEVTLGANS